MTSVDLKKIRSQLPYGSLNRIADTVGIAPGTVSLVFSYGWYPQYHSRIVDAALSIIDESIIDSDVLKHAEELGMTSSHSVFVPRKPRKSKTSSASGWGEDFDDDESALEELNFDDLCELVVYEDVDIDLDDFDVGFLTTESGRAAALREAFLGYYYDF
jgi:hypothetical protein